MPIKSFGRYPPWDARGWPEAWDPPTLPIQVAAVRSPNEATTRFERLSRPLDEPDAATPLFDAVWRIHGMGGRHALNPDREVPAMSGRHFDEDGDGIADGAQVGELPHDDGVEPDEPYSLVHPDEFEEG